MRRSPFKLKPVKSKFNPVRLSVNLLTQLLTMANHHIQRLFRLAFFVALTPLSAMGGIYKQIPKGLNEVDVIVAGGKWTSC